MKKNIFLFIAPLVLVSCGNNTNQVTLKYKSYSVVTFQPYFSQVDGEDDPRWPLPDGFTSYNQLLKGAGDYLKNNIPTITYKDENCSKDQYLNKELFKKLGPNQIILFEGHGSFDKWYENDTECHSVMWTGRDYKDGDLEDDDHKEFRLVAGDTWNEALTSNFIDEYVGDLTGSIVYLGNCLSGRDCTFAQSFLNKGASAVIGNSHTTMSFYNSCIEYTTIKYLGKINPATQKTYTLYEALSVAKSIYGKNDKERYEAACGSEAFIFGDPYFCLSEI